VVDTPAPAVLRASTQTSFDYTRSLGPVLGQFMTGLRDQRILGARGADGRVHAPPFEYDPVTASPPGDLFEVGPAGTVVSWTWMSEPLEDQPLNGQPSEPRPFGWALIRLDGADTAMLHAVDTGAAGSAAMRTGMRVRPRWAADRVGSIRDIECFEPAPEPSPAELSEAGPAGTGAEEAVAAAEPVTMMIVPIRLEYVHTASAAESAYLRGLSEGRLLGQRCPACGQVYVPSRGTCPADGVPTDTEVELPDTGTVTTFAIVNVGYPGQQLKLPYVAAAILLDGADIAFQHLILGCEPADVHLGMRVRAVWRPREEWAARADTITHFTPTGEPDAPYESYARHI
jgi:uncharacterized OB-fold protein